MDEFIVEENYGTKGFGKPQFQTGDKVVIVDRQTLERFRNYWKFVARPTEEQLQYAGVKTNVSRPAFYHGGYVLYELEDVPGSWLSPTIKEQ
ncbi:MAG TPA: hypothetical protein VFW34_08305 [Candidatus Rubrimentiphilum sp.]|nr:hypothetical protein [Candidatus Rubrimentiphilum sp.]